MIEDTVETHSILPDDGIFIIFGITGDLVKRKLLPALYQLTAMDALPANFKILGTTRRQTQVGDIITSIRKSLDGSGEKVNEEALQKLSNMITMVHMDIGQPKDYQILKDAIEKSDKVIGRQVNRLYYLAVPPILFEQIINNLAAYDLQACHGNTAAESRLLIEKPFGRDYNSAVDLINKMQPVFDEASIYRVDHYLAKETAQNILTFRINNPLFKAVWDNRSIASIMLTASEVIGIEGRVNFYEQTGALRDLIQSHLLQLLALTTMEEPDDRTAEAIHKSKLNLLESIIPIQSKNVTRDTVRGQYESYRREVNNPTSTTETYAAIRLSIDNDRWRNVPILLRTGKALREKITEITLVFKDNYHQSDDVNALTIRIQPNEGIMLSLLAKKPSLYDEKEIVQMKFFYQHSFELKQPDAYEKVLIDAIRGDKTLFTTDKEVLASWKVIEIVLKEWSRSPQNPEIYQNGSWGPVAADNLAHQAGVDWLTAYTLE